MFMQQPKTSTRFKLIIVLVAVSGICLGIYLISRFLGSQIPQMAFIAPIVDEKVLWLVGSVQGLSTQYGSLLTLGIGTLATGLAKAVSMISNLKKTKSEVQSTLATTKTSLNEASSSVIQLTSERETLTSSLDSAQTQITSLTGENKQLQESIQPITTELNTTKTQLIDVQSQLNKALADVAALRNDLNDKREPTLH